MIRIKEQKEYSIADTTVCPEPSAGESPLLYAERLGKWYSDHSPRDHKKTHGQYFTPAKIAEFMASLVVPVGPRMRILDPGAGCGVLSCAVCEYLLHHRHTIRSIQLDLYETDAGLSLLLNKSMTYLSQAMDRCGIQLEYHIDANDFILEYADALGDDPGIFSAPAQDYDLCIANPPYFKLSKSDRRSIAAMSVIYGQPNIYALFMAVSAALLKKGGQFVFITPRSFASGFYFKRFRTYFFDLIKPERIHLFDSRRDGFKKDGVLQEMIIVKGIRSDHWGRNGIKKEATIDISVSASVNELTQPAQERYAAERLLDTASPMKILRLPENRRQEQVVEQIASWPGSFRQYGLRISTGPVVAFRASNWLSNGEQTRENLIPLLWLHHIHAMRIQWPIEKFRKPQWLHHTDETAKLCVKSQNMVLLRRFSAKEEERRLVAAPYLHSRFTAPCLGLENHLNYIYRPDGTLSPEEAAGLAVLLNSQVIDTYFRVFNGNTQVGATEISLIPLPPHDVLIDAGEKALQAGLDVCKIESIAQLFFQTHAEHLL